MIKYSDNWVKCKQMFLEKAAEPAIMEHLLSASKLLFHFLLTGLA